jgi:hypothetical protein
VPRVNVGVDNVPVLLLAVNATLMFAEIVGSGNLSVINMT